MVIDSGFRCHLTGYTRATASAPSQFVSRLRKYLRTRRVTAVTQVGTDRIIDFQFSDGQFHLFLEFYAGGNIVLTDKDLGILCLLRIVPAGAEQEELRVGLKYSVEDRQNYKGVPTLTKERVLIGLRNTVDKIHDEGLTHTKKSKKKVGDALRKALSTSLNEFPPMLIDHALCVAGFDSSMPVEQVLKDDALVEQLMLVLNEAQRIISDITHSDSSKGYIVAKVMKPKVIDSDELPGEYGQLGANKLMYEDFHPFRPAQFEGSPESQILEFDGFNKTVDEFFSSIEGQKLESRLAEREEHAKRKLEAARQDHDKRIGGLQQVQDINIRKAQAIEANLQNVQEAIDAVNGLIAQGMDWIEIARLIEMEQARYNAVAEMIKMPLKLYENTATLLLAEADYEDEEDFEGDQTGSDVSGSEDEQHQSSRKMKEAIENRLTVDVDLALSPWSNARQYYDQKKSAAVKKQKTMQSSARALKNTEQKITADLKKGLKQEKQVLRPVRNQSWFEKFIYFISSDGYLVLGGKDAQQADILYKKHLKKGDVYVHADLQGAASVIVKNKSGMMDDPIPPSTLSQAGTLTVATSGAWESKAVMSAWWIDSGKVTKMAPNGDILAPGIFHIGGQKNFLPPAHLLLGVGVMFRISDESKARHLKHRLPDQKTSRSDTTGDALEENQPNYSDDNETDGHTARTKSEDNSDEESLVKAAKNHDSTSAEDEGDDDHYCGLDITYENPLQTNRASTSISHKPEADGDPAAVSKNSLDQSTATESSENEGSDSKNPISSQENSELLAVDTSRIASGARHLSTDECQVLHNGALSSPSNPTHSSQGVHGARLLSITGAPTSTSSVTISTPSEKIIASSQTPYVRGKQGKRNKIETKYANQDDDDRALALRLLGSAAEQKTTGDAAAKLAKEQEIAAQKERRRQQHATIAAKSKEAEAIRQTNFEAGIDKDEDDESVDLEAFVGMPLPGDEILESLVVCGPWDAVGTRCRWRAKLQPGTTKKGKAVREILEKWTSIVTDWERKKRPAGDGVDEAVTMEMAMRRREGDFVKGMKETEVVGVVPVGKCRVLMGGDGTRRGKSGGGVGKGKRGGKGSKKR